MRTVTFIVSMFLFTSLHAQDSAACEVKMDQLKGKYSGDCVKGKANGKGTATGIDKYEGLFKNGLPDGNGKYTWKNGDVYIGDWKKGMKEGKGELSEKQPDGLVKFTKGFWKKDVYKGEHEVPYVVHSSTSEFGKTEFNYTKSNTGSIRIELRNQSGTTNVRTTDFMLQTGAFVSKNVNSNAFGNTETTNFQGVQFPFRGTFYFGNRIIDFEIFEAGSWDVIININI